MSALAGQTWRLVLRVLLGVLLLILMPMALAGCAMFHPPKSDLADRAQIVTVDRAVPVGCVDAGSLPQVPTPVGAQLSGEARHDAAVLAQALLAERSARDKAMALLSGCMK